MIVKSKKLVMGFPHNPTVWCPGCQEIHVFNSRWKWNGDVEKPTFSPSFLSQVPNHKDESKRRCHSFLRDGVWQFLDDCTHELAGQNVPLPDFPDWFLDDE